MANLSLAVLPIKSQDLVKRVLVQSSPIEREQIPAWSWAASVENVLKTYGVKIAPEAIVNATYNGTVNLPPFDPEQAVSNLLKNGYMIAPPGMVVLPYFIPRPPKANYLVRELAREKAPILIFCKDSPGKNHVVVCYGADYTGDESDPEIVGVYIKDPQNIMNNHWGGSQLDYLWQGTIFLRVAPLPKSPFLYNGAPYVVNPTFEIARQSNCAVEGRVWFSNESQNWRIVDVFGQDRGPIP